MKKTLIIFATGLIAGILDLIPLFLVQAPFFNMLSVIVFWLSASLFIAKTRLIKNSLINGLLIAILLMLPLALAVSATNPKDFAPMMLMAIILGPLVGFLFSKFLKDK